MDKAEELNDMIRAGILDARPQSLSDYLGRLVVAIEAKHGPEAAERASWTRRLILEEFD